MRLWDFSGIVIPKLSMLEEMKLIHVRENGGISGVVLVGVHHTDKYYGEVCAATVIPEVFVRFH